VYEHTAGRDLKRSWEWLEFAAGLPGRPFAYTGQSASFMVFKGRGILQNLVVNNGNAAGQTIILHDGEDASGPLVHQAFIGNSQNQVQPFLPRGVFIETGVFAELFGGPWKITAVIVPLWHSARTPPGE
jgi:hypothetical protein